MRRVFPNYKRDYEMAVKVMGAMAEEIIKLRDERTRLEQNIRELQGIIEAQGEELFDLHMDVRHAKAALNREK